MSLTVSRPFTIETYDPPSTRVPPSYDYVHAFDLVAAAAGQSSGQVSGGKSGGKRSTPPDSLPENRIDRTPPSVATHSWTESAPFTDSHVVRMRRVRDRVTPAIHLLD